MTLRDRQYACLADLAVEREAATDPLWIARLDQKIADMRAAMEAVQ